MVMCWSEDKNSDTASNFDKRGTTFSSKSKSSASGIADVNLKFSFLSMGLSLISSKGILKWMIDLIIIKVEFHLVSTGVMIFSYDTGKK